jgi:hypothetical protein
VPPFLHLDWLLAQLSPDRAEAHRRYADMVEEALDATSRPKPLGELYVGTRAFVAACHPPPPHSPEHPTRQRHAPRPALEHLLATGSDIEIASAVHQHGYRLVEIANHLHIHPPTVTRRLQAIEASIQDMAERRESRPDP